MKMNKMRRFLTLALVLIAAVSILASVTVTAGAEESFEVTVVSEAYNNTCGIVEITWTEVDDASYYIVYINGEHVASILDTRFVCAEYKNDNGDFVKFDIGTSYEFKVVAMYGDDTPVSGKSAAATATPRHDYTTYYSDAEGHWCDCGIETKVSHTGGTATCITLADCEVCNTPYGSFDENNHASSDVYFTSADSYSHEVYHSCCDKVKETLEHAPSYVYTLDGSKITATCSDCGFASSVTLTAPTGSLVYSGHGFTASVSSNIFGLTEADVVYKKDGVVLAGAPDTAGDFTAELTLGDKTATVSFTIAKAIVTVPGTTNSVYDGGSHSSGLTDTELYTVTDNGGVNVGTYNATLSLTDKENYMWNNGSSDDVTLSYNITVAQDKITVSGETINITYGELLTPHAATSIFGTVNVTVIDKNGDEVDISELLNAGSYTICYEIADTANWLGDSATVSVVVAKADTSINVDTSNITLVYNQALTVPTASPAGFGTVTYNVYDNSFAVVTDLTRLPVGTYTIAYFIAGTDNWNSSSVDVIVKVNPDTVAIPEADTTEFTYNGAQQTYTVADSDLYTVSGNVEMHAGVYTVVVSLADSHNYTWSDGTKADKTYSFSIGKKAVTVTANAATTEQYYGFPEFTFTYDGFVNGESFTAPIILGVNITDTKTVGTSAIVKKSGSVSSDYTIVYVSAELTITEHVTHINGSVIVENYVGATCTVNGSYDNVIYCTLCDVELSRDTVVIDATGHSHTDAVTDPTCTEQGYTTHTCHCGDTYVDTYVDALGHTPGAEATCTTAQNCTVCGEKLADAIGHDWNEGEITTEPTCTVNGVKTYTCNHDNTHTYTESVAAIGHDWNDGEITTDPTCTENGVKTYTCNHDNTHTYTVSVAALGHEYESEVTTAPTCTENGIRTYICKHDGTHTYDEVEPAFGHEYESEITTAPTCTEDGIRTYTCKHDGTHTYDEVEPATGHTPGDEATCTTDQICTECGEKLVEAFGHTPGAEATCTTDQVCTVCNAVLKNKLGHDMNGFADCSADYVCPVCNEVARPASEHTYISEDTATCTKEGHMLSTCTTCGHKHIGQATPAKGHSFGKATCISLPICSVCGAEDTTAKLAACVHVWVSNGDGTHTGYCTSGRETHNVCNISCRPKSAATCTEDSVCSICSGVITPAFGHTFEGECTEYQYCKTCNALSDREPGHVRKTLIKIGNVKLIKLAICEDCGIWMYQYTVISVSIIALGVLLFFFRKFVLALPDSTDPFFKRIFRGRRFRR